MSERTPVRVSADTLELLRKIAAARDIEIGDAADLAVKTANSRLNALAKYAKKTGADKPKKEKKPKILTAKKGRKKKAKKASSPKAKGARKAAKKGSKKSSRKRPSSKTKTTSRRSPAKK